MKTGIELITEERQRQITKEGYTPIRDEAHDHRELASAASSYVSHYVARAWTFNNELGMPGITDGPFTYRSRMPDSWPWDEESWKPKNPLYDLVRAGALIAAEIDRVQRLTKESEGV